MRYSRITDERPERLPGFFPNRCEPRERLPCQTGEPLGSTFIGSTRIEVGFVREVCSGRRIRRSTSVPRKLRPRKFSPPCSDAFGRLGGSPIESSQPVGHSPRVFPTRLSLGGSEGLAMLNRTNRTPSANPLGLNLGTRTLAVKANANFGKQTSHFAARVHPARAGVLDVVDSTWLDSIMIRSYPLMPMSMLMAESKPTGSSPQGQPSKRRGCAAGHSGRLALLASRIAASPVPPGTGRQAERSGPRSRSRQLAQGCAERSQRTQRQPSQRDQVPDATP